MVALLASRRAWVIEPPQFVDSVEEPVDRSRGDLAVETLGGVLELYSAMPPWVLPQEVDAQHLAEVKDLVEAVTRLSRRLEISFDFELDGNPVGAVRGGVMNRLLAEGLLGEWERHLALAP